MTLTLVPVRVATGFDEEGLLVLDEGQRLLAVLTHLSDDNEVAPGQCTWRQLWAAGWDQPPRF